jgi:hypothetical protein
LLKRVQRRISEELIHSLFVLVTWDCGGSRGGELVCVIIETTGPIITTHVILDFHRYCQRDFTRCAFLGTTTCVAARAARNGMNSILGAKVAAGAKPTTIVVKQGRCFSVCSFLALESQPILAVVAGTVY